MISLSIHDDFRGSVDESSLMKVVKSVFKHLNQEDRTGVSIVIDNDDTIKSLNQQFRGIDQVTDVLSFPANEVDPQTGEEYIGDVILSYQQVERQARIAGNNLVDEITLLVIHGVLHLLGFDHDSSEKKENMWSIQNKILRSLGINDLTIPD